MKICSKCSRIVSYNSYFKACFCSDCGWYEEKIMIKDKLKQTVDDISQLKIIS